MILPNAHDESWSECPSWIHASTGVLNLCKKEQKSSFASVRRYNSTPSNGIVTYCSQMSGGDRQSNGKWAGSLVIAAAIIANAVNNKNQNEGDQSFDQNGLTNIEIRIDGSVAQITAQNIVGCGELEMGISYLIFAYEYFSRYFSKSIP